MVPKCFRPQARKGRTPMVSVAFLSQDPTQVSGNVFLLPFSLPCSLPPWHLSPGAVQVRMASAPAPPCYKKVSCSHFWPRLVRLLDLDSQLCVQSQHLLPPGGQGLQYGGNRAKRPVCSSYDPQKLRIETVYSDFSNQILYKQSLSLLCRKNVFWKHLLQMSICTYMTI